MQMYMVNLEHISYVSNDKTNTGIGRALAIKRDLDAFQLGDLHIQEYFVSGCFDGQYILGDIENKLREILSLPTEFDCHWDFDHFLEIIHKNVLANSSWAQKILNFTNTVNREFGRSDKKTQLMVEQNTHNNQENVKNKTIKGHSKVSKYIVFA